MSIMGSLRKGIFFILKDAYTKWIEVFETKSTKSFDTIAALLSVFGVTNSMSVFTQFIEFIA